MEKTLTKEIKDLEILIGKRVLKDNPIKVKLNHTQFRILIYLMRNQDKDICQKDLEIETHLKKASITGTLDSLEDKGLICRKVSPDDKRKNVIVLTDEILLAKDTIENRFRELEKQLLNNISEEELEQFYKTIEKLKENLK